MKQSGHLNPSEEPEVDAPSLQSMEGYLQTSMEVWVDYNNRMSWKYDDDRCVCLCGDMESEKHVLFDCNIYDDVHMM